MKSRQEPLVSVVTPVYNGEPYLRDCIESVLAQTYTHWDYAIVNNCSADRTLEIAQEYAAKDPRIRVCCNATFIGAIENYNNALRQISPKSKYAKVVAADDWLFPECIEKMVGLAEEHPNAAIIGAYGLQGKGVVWQGLPYPSTVVNGRELCRLRLLGGPYVFGTPTSLLYQSNIVRSRHAFYNESNIHHDSEVCLEFLENHDFGFVHQILTCQGVRPDSRTSHSGRLQTYLPWILYELAKYGPKYLSEEELEQRINEHTWSYYRYLAEQAFKWRGREFWSYHRRELANLGQPLSATRLTAHALSYVLDLVFNRNFSGKFMRQRHRIWSKQLNLRY